MVSGDCSPEDLPSYSFQDSLRMKAPMLASANGDTRATSSTTIANTDHTMSLRNGSSSLEKNGKDPPTNILICESSYVCEHCTFLNNKHLCNGIEAPCEMCGYSASGLKRPLESVTTNKSSESSRVKIPKSGTVSAPITDFFRAKSKSSC